MASVSRADEPAPGLRVFYTGHSFHMFVPGRVAQYVKAADLKDYHLSGTQNIGGSRIHACGTAERYHDCPVCPVFGVTSDKDFATPTRLVVRQSSGSPRAD